MNAFIPAGSSFRSLAPTTLSADSVSATWSMTPPPMWRASRQQKSEKRERKLPVSAADVARAHVATQARTLPAN
eukprot:1181968-Prorocentrum_minimum.AAC.2